MKYGHFADETKEYILTTPFTPIKWINYVGTLDFGGFVDNTGGCLICKHDPALNRITKYIAQLPQSEFKGSTIYVRIKDKDGKYQVFSPFYTPTLKNLDSFEHRVGLSYSSWTTQAFGLKIEIRIFVPRSDQTLLQDIQITNISGKPLEVDIIPVYEFTHFDALKQLVNADWVPQTMQVHAHKEDSGCVILEQYAFMKKNIAVNYVTADRKVRSFDGDRRCFLGNNEFGSWADPLSLQNDDLSNSECLRGDNIAALLIPLGTLTPGAKERTCCQLGQQSSLKQAQGIIKKYRNLGEVDKAFDELKAFWEGYLDTMIIETPDTAMNSMLNIHNPRQCHTTKNWSRYLSLYQLGYGARGIGFRDSSQDLIGVISHMPDEGKAFIEKLLSVQKRDGSAMHQFFPLSMEANEGDSREEPELPNYYGDDHLWICQTVSQYLKETGDIAFLDKEIPFYEKDKSGKALESGTVYEHLKRAVEFTWNDRGQHNLPKLGFADWNDTVNLPTGAESLMIANLFGKALIELIDICESTNKKEDKKTFQTYYDEMKKAVNEHSWDGQWYIRYFTAEGQKIGSKDNEKGQIYTNGQSWPVISGFATQERAVSALNSVFEKLNTTNGIKLSYPGYNGYDPKMGGITTYPPGAKENGGIFLHSNPWVMIAEAIIGNGDRAFEYYNQINPAAKNNSLDTFESEPYCYPQNILGDEHPLFGLGRNAWLSGTSSWTYVAGTQWILGIKPTMKGLKIDPCIPSSWDGFKVTRKFRGATYLIEISNPTHISKGIKSIEVDGKKIEGNILPLFKDGEHSIIVTMG